MAAARIQEGDIIGFLGNPRNLGHLIIMFLQLFNGGDNDSLWRIVHVGIVVKMNGKLFLAEFLLFKLFPWPKGGMRLTPLGRRVREYEFGTIHFPLDGDARKRFVSRRLTAFVKKVRKYGYNILGLIFALLRFFVGWQRAGCFFCSEFAREALSFSRAWNGVRVILKIIDGEPEQVEGRVEPQRFSPWDIGRAPILDRWQVVTEELLRLSLGAAA